MKPVALITGGTRGIGLGVARALGAANFDLAVCGVREKSDVQDALNDLRATGADAQYFQADVSAAPDRARLVAGVRGHFGRLNVLVNNAGVAPTVRADILEATEESFERVLRINLRGPYFLTQAVAKWMLEQKRADAGYSGTIVNISSISATVASTSRGDYCISKAGVAMATALWATRLAESGLRVYEVRPGLVKTDMTSAVEAKYDKLIANGLLLQPRWGLPEDVGKAVSALAQGALPYSPGQVIVVDGGLTMPRL